MSTATKKDSLHERMVVFPDTEEGNLLASLSRSKEFGRLKNIKQISFSSNRYGQGTHTRYIHSLGVYYLADKILEKIKKDHSETYSSYQAKKVRIRALLHDIGHGPKSHSWEKVMHALGHTRSHEEWGHSIVLSDDTQIGKILAEHDAVLHQEIAQSFLQKEQENFWDSIVSSQLDADRLDYLQRDFAGSGLGKPIDEAYLLESVQLAYANENHDICLAFNVKAEAALMQFLQSRVTLYRAVSLHKHSESADALLVHVFSKLQEVFREHGPEKLGFSDKNPMVRIIMAEPDQIEVSDYLRIDDSFFDYFLNEVIHSDNEHMKDISEIAARLNNDEPLGVVDLTAELPDKSEEAFSRAKEIFEEMKANCEDGVLCEFSQYRKPSYRKTENIYENIMIANGGFAQDISDRVNSMPNDIVICFVFSSDDEFIEEFKAKLKSDKKLQNMYKQQGYGIPVGAVPAPQMI